MATTIDNKTVQMNFDNQNFERNISQSMNSLKNMDTQLQGLEKNKGLETLNKQAKQMDFNHMSKGLQDVKVRFSALQVAGATVISELTKKVMAFGSNLAKNTIGQIKSGGITRALNLDQAEFQIKGLGKTWSKIIQKGGKETEVGIKRDVLNAVSGTQYGLDEAAKIASQLLSSNVKQGKELEGVLRSIAGVASMTNSSYTDMGNLYAKVAGNGRMMSQELLQLSARGLNAAAIMRDYINANDGVRKSMIAVGKTSKGKGKEVAEFANKTKLTEQNVRTLASAGAIDFKNFAKAMEKSFGKAASKANETYAGSLANVKAALSRIGADVAVPIYTRDLRKTFVTLIGVIDDFHEALTPLIKLIDSTSKQLFKNVRNFAKNIDMKAVSQAIQTITTALSGFINELTSGFSELYKTISTTFKSILNVSNAVSGSNKVVSGLGSAITWLGNILSRVLKIISNIIKVLSPILIPIIQTIFNLIKSVGNFILNTLTNISNAISQNETVFSKWATNIATLFNTVKPVFSALWNLGSAVFDAISKALGNLFDSLKNSKSKGFDTFVDGLKGIVNVISNVINKIAEFIRETKIIQSVGFLFSNVIKGIGYVLTHLGTVIGKVLKGISNFFSQIRKGFDIKDTLKNIIDTLKNSINSFVKMLNQNGDTVLKGSIFTLLIVKIKQLINVFNSSKIGSLLTTPKKLSTMLTTLNKSIAQFSGFYTLKAVATSILELAVALLILSGINKEKLNTAITAITGLFLNLLHAYKSIEGVGKFKTGPVFKTLLGTATAVLILSVALKKLASIDEKDLWGSIGAVIVLMQMLINSIHQLSSKSDADVIVKGAGTIIALSFAIRIMSSALTQMSKIKSDKLWQSVAAILVLMNQLSFTVKSLASKKEDKEVMQGAAIIIALSIAIKILSSAVIGLAKLSWDELLRGLAGVAALLYSIWIYIKSINSLGSDFGAGFIKASAGLILVGLAINTIAKSVRILGKMKPEQLEQGLLAITGIMVALIAFSAFVNEVGSASLEAAAGMLVVAVAMRVLVSSISILGKMKVEELNQGLMAFSTSLLVLAVALNAMTGTLSGSAALVTAAAGILVLSLALKVISSIPIVALIGGVVGMAGALLVLYLAVFTLSGAISSIFALGIAILSFGAGVALLGVGLLACAAALKIFVSAIVNVVTGLKDILIAIVEAIIESIKLIIVGIGEIAPELFKTLLILLKGTIKVIREIVPDLAKTLMEVLSSTLSSIASNIGPIVQSLIDIIIGIINGVASRVGDLTDAIGNLLGAIGDQIVKAIGNISMDSILKLLLSITAISLIIKMLSSMQTQAAKAIITVALIAVSLLILTGVFALIGMIDNSLTDKLNAITVFLAVMTLVLIGCAIIGNFAAQALIGLGVLIIAIAAITGVMIALGALADLVEPFINKGGPLLVKIGSFIGQFIGAFVAGIATQAVQAIPALGEALGAFGVAIGPFIDALNKMSLDALAKIAILVAIVMAITATSFLSGITKFLSFGNDPIDEFIITIVKLAEGFKKFNSVISGVDASGAETAANVIAKLAIAANLIPSSGGWLQNLVGNKDLDGFGKAIISLANGLKIFANSVDTSIDVEALTPYVNLIKKIAEIANLIPRSGGWLQNIAGNKDLAGFGNAITPLADGIKGFADKAAEIKDPSALENIINIVKKMVEVQNDLPKSGGLWQAIAGEQDWSQLSEGLNSMVDCFKSISKTLNSKSVNLDVITTAVNLLKDIAKVNNDAIKIGDKADKKKDEGDSQTFVSKIVEPVKKAVNKIKEYQKTLKQSDMESMTGYFKVLKNFINTLGKEFSDKETQKNLKLVETVGNTIASLLTSVLKIRTLMSNNSKKGKGEDSLTSQLTAFGDTIVAFSTTMAKIDLTGITQGKNAVDTLKSMSDLKIDKFSTAKTSVENLKTALKAFKDLNKEKLSTGKDGQGGQLKTLKTYVKNIKTAIKDMASDLGKNSDVDKALKNVKGFGSKVKTFSSGLKSLASAFKEINGTTINSKKGQDIADAMTNVSKGGINKFVKGLEGNKGKIKSAYNTFLGKVKSVAKKDNATYEAFRQAGKNTINGYVKGLDDLKGSVSSKYRSIMNANIRVVAKVNKSKSPSKVYENLGLYTMQGYEKGVTKGAVAVKSTLSGTLTTINNKLESGLETGIKNKKVLKFAKSYYKQLWNKIKSVSGIGNFRDLFNQGASKNAIKKYFDDAAIELYAENNNKRTKKIKKNLQKYYKTISKYEKKYGKDAEKDLEKRVNKAEEKYNKKHTKARKDRLKRAKKDLNAYTKARDKRKELTDAIKSDWEELSNTIKDNAHSFLDPLSNAIDTGIDLFTKFERGQRISSSRMLANMRSQIKAASDYNADVDKLRNKGLSESLIKQLKEQGISGWENVKAFLRMTPEQIAEANSLDQAKTKMSFETMMTGLVDRINQAKSWKQKIAELTRRGIDKNALKEILNMGIEEAGPYIDALLSADNAQLAIFNKKFNAARSLDKDLAKSGLSSYAKSVNEGATNKINKKSGKKASDQYVNGIIKGLTDKNNKKKIKHAAGGLAQTIINEVNRRLKIKSPSREGERSGMYTVLGLVQGIAQNLNLAQNAGEELADAIITPLDQLEDTQNSVGENPTITPILDLDRLERDLQELDNMFKNDYAIGIAASMSRDGNIGGAQNTKNGDIINNYNNEFTQNNYSPKPLDRVGIYRDTKGWINSKMKGGVATT